MGIKLDKYSDKMEKVVKEIAEGLRGGILHYRLNQALYILKRLTNKNKTLTLWFGVLGEENGLNKKIFFLHSATVKTLV